MLALQGACLWRFPKERDDYFRSQSRAFGFCICLASFFMCSIGLTPPFEADGEPNNLSHFRYLQFGGVAAWLIGLGTGLRFKLGETTRKYNGLVVVVLGVLWWVTRDAKVSLVDGLLLAGIAALATSLIFGNRKTHRKEPHKG